MAVTREGKRPLAAFMAAVLVTALLAACGGSESSSTEATTGSSTATPSTAQNEGGDAQGGAKAQNPNDSQGQGDSQDSQSQNQQSGSDGQSGNGGGSEDVAAPLAVSGGGSAQFRTKGGDNSIQEFGEESDESELQEAAEVVHSFYVARAQEEWAEACSYLAKSNIEQLEQLGAQSPQFKGAGCAPILKAFTRPLSPSIDREVTTVDAGSLRREGEQGFLIYYGADRVKYAMPLRDEGGSWKVTALSGTTLG